MLVRHVAVETKSLLVAGVSFLPQFFQIVENPVDVVRVFGPLSGTIGQNTLALFF